MMTKCEVLFARTLAFVLTLFLAVAAFAQDTDENRIASIKIDGNKRIATETYLYYISAKPGAPYDEETLQTDFRRLWQTGFLDDLKIESERTPEGVVVTFKVTEKPLIKSLEFVGNKKVSTEDIQTKLKDESLGMRADQPFDPYQAKRITNAIDKLLVEKGLRFGSATYRTEPVGNSYVKVKFVVEEGPKVKIGKIDFQGNTVFSDGRLRRRMKDTKQHWLFSFLTKHDDFEKEKFEKDMERVQELYFNRGYINAKVDEPQIDLYEANGFFGKAKRMKLAIPVEEGSQYRIGTVTFEGNKLFPTAQLQKQIDLKKGKIFNRSLLKDGLEEIQKRYGDQGYIYASLGPVFDIQEDTKTVNVRVDVEENGQFYVNRIEFTGNTFTRDKVIRREMTLQEGDLLRVSRFRDSIDRIYRLGFFDDLKPNITPVEGKENLADISLDVKENKRNEIRLGGGYSQLEGFFGSLSFSTKNLLGTGKIFTIDLQNGTNASNYGIQILEPYFLDRRISLGFGLFKTRYDYNYYYNYYSTNSATLDYAQATVGGSITVGFPLVEEFKAALTYGYQVVNVTYPYSSTIDYSQIYPGYDLYYHDRTESRMTPQVVRSTINNPMDPSRGTRLMSAVEVVGGPFGGDSSYYRPTIAWTHYLPGLGKKHYFAYNVELGYASGYNHQVLPFIERYFLGGEQSIRGYELRSVGQMETVKDPVTGLPSLINAGGNKYFVANVEYVIPVAGPLKFAGFLDYGNAFSKGQGLDFTDMRGSTGLELRFLAPFLSSPFRFIYAINFNRGELMILPISVRPGRTSFRFSVGTTF